MERAADWDAQWSAEPLDPAAALAEEGTPRWRAQERLVRARFGGFDGLKTVEVGSGRGLNALLYAVRGAEVTLVDSSRLALEQAVLAQETFKRLGAAHYAGVAQSLVAKLSWALGTPPVATLPNVAVASPSPTGHAPAYRLWLATLKRRGTWPLGTEEPFSSTELVALARAAGGEPLEPIYGSFVASLVDHGLNQALYKLGPRGVRVPQARLPVLDRFAYELLLPVVRP